MGTCVSTCVPAVPQALTADTLNHITGELVCTFPCQLVGIRQLLLLQCHSGSLQIHTPPLQRGSTSWPSCTCDPPQSLGLGHCCSPTQYASNAAIHTIAQTELTHWIHVDMQNGVSSLTFNSPHSLKKLNSPFM